MKEQQIGKYIVTSEGEIYSHKKDGTKFKKKLDTSNGYARTYINGEIVSVSKLVAECFIEKEYPGLTMVRHKDFNPLNNDISNLEWSNKSNIKRGGSD